LGPPDPRALPCIRQRRLPVTAGDLHGVGRASEPAFGSTGAPPKGSSATRAASSQGSQASRLAWTQNAKGIGFFEKAAERLDLWSRTDVPAD
jgi:hypothetical protein